MLHNTNKYVHNCVVEFLITPSNEDREDDCSSGDLMCSKNCVWICLRPAAKKKDVTLLRKFDNLHYWVLGAFSCDCQRLTPRIR